MSMLAEPRRKKAWVLNPRKSEWADDDSKFGQKMLEQMGWSKGKGLGKQMAGITEHIRPSVQNDSRGLGYEGRSDDWVAHLDDFNDLLASLQQGKKGATGGEGPTKSTTVKSLEERSKKSRARVHYHKFTRGKDLSRYSSQDLASILGGRAEGAVASQPVTPVSSRPPSPPPHADSEPVSEAETETPQPPATEVDKSSGYTTISTGLSVKDYFEAKMRKMKMLKIKREQEQKDGSSGEAKSCGEAATEDVAEANASETVQQEAVKSKKKKKKRAASPAEQTSVAEEGGDASEQPKKKRKKSAANVGEVIPRVPEAESAVSDELKEAASPAEQALASVPDEERASTSEKSKKKKKKSASNVEEVVPPVPEEESAVSEEPPKKKKKRKNVASSPEESPEAAADLSPQPDVSPKDDGAPAVEPSEEAPADETEKAASKKKKKRKKSKSKRNDDSD